MSKVTIKSLGVLSVAKIYAVMMFVMSLIIAIPYGLIFMVVGASALGVKDGGAIGAGGIVGGLLIMIGLPILYGIFGFIGGAISALVYNLFAKMVGGIEMELDGIGVAGYMNPPPPPQQWQAEQPFNQYAQR